MAHAELDDRIDRATVEARDELTLRRLKKRAWRCATRSPAGGRTRSPEPA
jgi:hypothetical protein